MRLIGDYRFAGESAAEEQANFIEELTELLERFRVTKLDVCWERADFQSSGMILTIEQEG